VITGPQLTEALLEGLAERWRTLGAPIVDSMLPGLSDAEMDALVAPLGLRLPTEARVWWGWHDGVETGLLSHGIGSYIVPLRLAQAVEKHRQLLEIAADVTADDDTSGPDDFWRREWFPFAVPPRADLACDCSASDGEPTPIRYVEFELPAESQEPVASSLGAVVSLWIEAIDSGAWTYDHDSPPGWTTHPERLPRIHGWARNLIA
jgi:cell wall assembly regulator SMI1